MSPVIPSLGCPHSELPGWKPPYLLPPLAWPPAPTAPQVLVVLPWRALKYSSRLGHFTFYHHLWWPLLLAAVQIQSEIIFAFISIIALIKHCTYFLLFYLDSALHPVINRQKCNENESRVGWGSVDAGTLPAELLWQERADGFAAWMIALILIIKNSLISAAWMTGEFCNCTTSQPPEGLKTYKTPYKKLKTHFPVNTATLATNTAVCEEVDIDEVKFPT